MDKKTKIEALVRKAHEKGLFNGTWLYAEHGEILTKGARACWTWRTRSRSSSPNSRTPASRSATC